MQTKNFVTELPVKSIKVGEFEYQYSSFAQKRKTICLTVYPDKTILLKHPLGFGEEKIGQFLLHKALWLKKQFSYFDNLKISRVLPNQQSYLSGASFRYLGQQYMIKIVESQKNDVSIAGEMLQIFTKDDVRDESQNQKILEKWLKKQTQEVLNDRYKAMCSKWLNIDQQIPELKIRILKRRWGSCMHKRKENRFIITLNSRLIHKNKECIDYVIVHELCHLEHFNHSRQFYNLMEQRVANWKELKHKLEIMSEKIKEV
jgi:predicted metal-dependent hydrolase